MYVLSWEEVFFFFLKWRMTILKTALDFKRLSKYGITLLFLFFFNISMCCLSVQNMLA